MVIVGEVFIADTDRRLGSCEFHVVNNGGLWGAGYILLHYYCYKTFAQTYEAYARST